ncbi:MAG: transcriptional regulator NrdR [Planctomycetota bacterium]
MRCPFCKVDDDKVIDSRSSGEGFVVRRRRECLACKKRYTTYERIEELPVRVVKKDGRRESFDREKILRGMMRACEKRPVSTETLDRRVTHIEQQIAEGLDREVTTEQLGTFIMEQLKELDQVAYVRFASVYREFKDITDFLTELQPMLDNKTSKGASAP